MRFENFQSLQTSLFLAYFVQKFSDFEVKVRLDFLLTNVVVALEVANEAFEELSDATAFDYIEDTLRSKKIGTMT